MSNQIIVVLVICGLALGLSVLALLISNAAERERAKARAPRKVVEVDFYDLVAMNGGVTFLSGETLAVYLDQNGRQCWYWSINKQTYYGPYDYSGDALMQKEAA